MRTYAANYNMNGPDGPTWSIIARDFGDETWFTFQQPIQDKETAIQIADALNLKEQP